MRNQPPSELRAVARQAAKDELADADEYTRQMAGHIGEVVLQAVWQALEKLSTAKPVFRYANWECEGVRQEASTPETDDGKPCVTLE